MKRGAVLALVPIAFLLAGCSLGQDAPGTYVPTSGEAAFYPQAAEGLGDAVSGTLAVTDGCLVVQKADDTAVVPVFGGADATWDGTTLTVGDETFVAGDAVTFTGGHVDEGYLGPMTYMPTGCDKTAAFFVAPRGGD